MKRDLNAVKTFFDPHPGFAGAAIPIPKEVRKVANNLDGKSMTLFEAVKQIQAVTTGTVSVAEHYDFIALEIFDASGAQYPRHYFRVIKFK